MESGHIGQELASRQRLENVGRAPQEAAAGGGEPGGTEHAANLLKLNSNSGCLYVNKHTWPGAAMLASAEPAQGSTEGAER